MTSDEKLKRKFAKQMFREVIGSFVRELLENKNWKQIVQESVASEIERLKKEQNGK